MLRRLLTVFDDDEKVHSGPEVGKKQRGGCKGVAHGHKLHLLDAMNITKATRTGEKYARPISIVRSWLKANCLPQKAQQHLEELGNRSSMQPLDSASLTELCAAVHSLCSVASNSKYLGLGIEDLCDFGTVSEAECLDV